MTFFRLFFLLVGPICAAVAYRTVVRTLRLERAWSHALVIALLLVILTLIVTLIAMVYGESGGKRAR